MAPVMASAVAATTSVGDAAMEAARGAANMAVVALWEAR
jgi:hypothetical protein